MKIISQLSTFSSKISETKVVYVYTHSEVVMFNAMRDTDLVSCPSARTSQREGGAWGRESKGAWCKLQRCPRHQTRAISNTKLSLCVVGSRSEDERVQARGRPLPLAGHHHPARQDMENALLRR